MKLQKNEKKNQKNVGKYDFLEPVFIKTVKKVLSSASATFFIPESERAFKNTYK